MCCWDTAMLNDGPLKPLSRRLLILLLWIMLIPYSAIHGETGEEPAQKELLHRRAVELARSGKHDQAIQILEQLLETSPADHSLRYDFTAVLSWDEQDGRALTEFKKVSENEGIPLYVLSAAALSARRRQQLMLALSLYRRILDRRPDHRDAKQGYILCASALGAPNIALELIAREKEPWLPVSVIEQVRGDRAAQLVRWGEITPESEAERYGETDRALQLLRENLERTKQQGETAQRFQNRARFDALIALRNRVEMEETAERYENYVNRGLTIPLYAINQSADAYLYLARPQTAKKLYQEFLEKYPDHFNVSMSLCYALLESENYGAAGQLLDSLVKKQPTWFRLKDSRVYGENPQKLSADMTAVMFRAYSRRLHKALPKMREKLRMAPFNRDIRTQLGKLYLWRGWPRKALHQFNLAAAREPAHLEARIWRTHTWINLHQYGKAADTVRRIHTMYPEKRAAQKLKRNWDTQQMWYFHSEMRSGRGQGLVLGSRDVSIENYLYTPPIHHWFKGFLHQVSHSADFFGETAAHRRWGVGVDYNRGDWGAQVEIMRRFAGDPDYGYRAGLRWQINDYWELSAEGVHNGIDVPLKGRVLDLKADSAALNLLWRLNEGAFVKAAVSTDDFNDGNRRYALYVSGSQRLITGPKFLLDASLDLYTSSNSLDNRYYFNPESDLSITAAVDAWHTPYRRYDFKFVHRLVLGYGGYRQKRFDPGAVWVIRYEHHWDLDDRRAFLYGISHSRRVYDGNPEKGTTVYVTINWRF